MKLKNLFVKYTDANTRLAEITLPKYAKLKAYLFGILLALLCVSGPIAFWINLFVFNELFMLAIFGLMFSVVLFVLLSEMFIRGIVKNYSEEAKEISFKLNYLMDFIIYFAVCLLIFGIFAIIARCLQCF